MRDNEKLSFLKNRKFITGATMLSLTGFMFVFYYLDNNTVGAQVIDKPIIPNPALLSNQGVVANGGILTPAQFLDHGGRSVIMVSRDNYAGGEFSPVSAASLINASRGETVKIPLTLTHVPGSNPLSSVAIFGKGISDDLIPPSVAKTSTPEERAALIQQGKKIPGALDLNSTATFSPKLVILKPGDVKELDVYITIPKDWPDELVGKNVWYSIMLADSEGHERPDLFMKQIGVQLHVVS